MNNLDRLNEIDRLKRLLSEALEHTLENYGWFSSTNQGAEWIRKAAQMIIDTKSAVFTPAELDYICCALIRYQTDLRARTNVMERFAAPEHLANHRAKIALGEKLLALCLEKNE